MCEVASKILKQIEYYFGDINLSKDKHLSQLISSSTDGWVSYEEMLKFPRLKAISDDKEAIRIAISGSKVVEANETGIRRNPELEAPLDLNTMSEMHTDKTLYIKGFKSDETIDDIIAYLETFGGPTMNLHMRRIPKTKCFKGSVFAIFNLKEDAEKFLSNEEAAKFKECDMERMWISDYNLSKKNEYDEKHRERNERQQSAHAQKEALLDTKMTKGALIQLTGFENSAELKEGEEVKPTGDFCDDRDKRSAVKNFKIFLTEKLAEVAPVSWVEHFPATGKVIVRFGKENAAEEALKALTGSEETSFKYQVYNLSGVVLSGEEEKDYWRIVLNEQSNRNNKRGGRFGGGRCGGGPDRKRMRR